MKIEIKITKEVLRRSMWCDPSKSGHNCAIAFAIREIFPEAWIGKYDLRLDGKVQIVDLPKSASDFIWNFDRLSETPGFRLDLPEFSFEIDVPDEVIERIGINEAKAILEKSETLNLVEA